CKIVAVSDTRGGIYNESGLDPSAVLRHKQEQGSVVNFRHAQNIGVQDVLEVPCDILIPAATEGVITEANADRVLARIVTEAANGPTTPEADEYACDMRLGANMLAISRVAEATQIRGIYP